MNIFLMEVCFELSYIDLVILYIPINIDNITVFNELKELFNRFTHLVSLSRSKCELKRRIDSKTLVLKLIQNVFFLLFSLLIDFYIFSDISTDCPLHITLTQLIVRSTFKSCIILLISSLRTIYRIMNTFKHRLFSLTLSCFLYS